MSFEASSCEDAPRVRLDEGRLSFRAAISWRGGSSPYKRERARLNGSTALL